jgi:hypothetical protein
MVIAKMKTIEQQIEFEEMCLHASREDLKQQEENVYAANVLIRYYGKALNNFKEYGEGLINCFDEDFNREQYYAAFDKKENAEKWIEYDNNEIAGCIAKIDELRKEKFAAKKAAEQNWLHDKKYVTGNQLSIL